MQARSIYLSSSPADTTFRDALVSALQRAGAHALTSEIDRPITQSRPLDDALLRRCDSCVVILTRAALGAPRMLSEVKRFAELAQQEPRRALIVALLEPIAASDLWPFLYDAPRVEGPEGVQWTTDALIFGVLNALGLPYNVPYAAPRTGSLAGARNTLPPPTLAMTGMTRVSLPPQSGLQPTRNTLPPTLATTTYASPPPPLPRVNRTTTPINWEALQAVDDPWAAIAEPLMTAPVSAARTKPRPRSSRRSNPFLPLVVAVSLVFVLALSGLVLLRQDGGPLSIGSATIGSRGATATQARSAAPTATHAPTRVPAATATRQPTATATPLPTNWAQFVKMDTATQGSWMGVYGAQGAYVFDDGATLPSSIVVKPSGDNDCSAGCWASQTSDPRALEKVSDPTNTSDRIAACWYTPGDAVGNAYTIDVNITDGQTHLMALYLLDWDGYPGGGRSESITLSDGSSASGGIPAAVFDTQNVSQMQNGVYLVWKVRGHVLITVTNARAGSNAVASGLFFSAAPQ